eukprot:snap_masked-scaffold_8-processed-gene-2.38-mRNA-1 protein AED:0.44 eAED:0.44 QI:0/0/0/0.33/1/1/3/0/211
MGKTKQKLAKLKQALEPLVALTKKKKKIRKKLEKFGISLEEITKLIKQDKAEEVEKSSKEPVKEKIKENIIESSSDVETKPQSRDITEADVFPEQKEGKRFKRVDDSYMHKIKNNKLKDNSYIGTFGSDGWGSKANDKLKYTRGKGFRHEKTKKKRGSYRVYRCCFIALQCSAANYVPMPGCDVNVDKMGKKGEIHPGEEARKIQGYNKIL